MATHMNMDMTFWFGSNIDNFLFKGLGIHTAWSMVVLCLIMMGFAIFYESFKVNLTYFLEIFKF